MWVHVVLCLLFYFVPSCCSSVLVLNDVQVGYKVERISKGKYSEIFASERSFTQEEDEFWSKAAMQVQLDFETH